MRKPRLFNGILTATLFGAGVMLGSTLNPPEVSAGIELGDWQTLSQDPDFRKAVIAVIDSCLVDNGMIYCD